MFRLQKQTIIYIFAIFLFPFAIFANELGLKTIQVKGYETTYHYGGEKSPYFLLVHGLGVDKRSFIKFADVLVKRYNYKIILPEIPGQGNTKRIVEKDYSIESMADFLYELLKILKIKKVILVGNSMGGHIAVVFFLKYPDFVKGLVLISPSGILFQNQKPYQFIDENYINSQNNLILQESLRWNNKIRGDIQKNKYYILNDFLQKILISTFLFWGTDDTIIPYNYSSVWASEIPDIHFYVLKGGHLLQNESPEVMLNKLFKNPIFIKLLQ